MQLVWFDYDNCGFVTLSVVMITVGYSVACWFTICGWVSLLLFCFAGLRVGL